jgi:ParB/RepB/Spo0J family partition protein
VAKKRRIGATRGGGRREKPEDDPLAGIGLDDDDEGSELAVSDEDLAAVDEVLAEADKLAEARFEFVRVSELRISRDIREDGEVEVEELAESVGRPGVGVQLPVLVSESGEVLDGRRRVRAARLAKVERVPAVILPEAEEWRGPFLEMLGNVSRVDLTAMERARGYRRLTEPPYDFSVTELAAMLGKRQSAVSRDLTLLDAPASTREAVGAGKKTVATALAEAKDERRRARAGGKAAKVGRRGGRPRGTSKPAVEWRDAVLVPGARAIRVSRTEVELTFRAPLGKNGKLTAAGAAQALKRFSSRLGKVVAAAWAQLER